MCLHVTACVIKLECMLCVCVHVCMCICDSEYVY